MESTKHKAESQNHRHLIKNEKQQKEIYAMLPYFQNAVVLGDSMAESILDYRLLRKHNVIGKRGRCIDMIGGDILVAASFQPEVLFMVYGKNDISHFQGNPEVFIRIYQEQIQKIQQLLPDTKIFINSIIPMRKDILDRVGGFAVLNRFNESLRAMCEGTNLCFIDNAVLMDWQENDYEYDGIHPKYPYYPKWLRKMAQEADLIG